MKIISKKGYLWRDWTEVFLCQGINNHEMVQFTLPGNEIPNSFIHSSPSSSILLQLPLPMKNHIVGIILCGVYTRKSPCDCFKVEINGIFLEEIRTDWSNEFDQVSVAYFPRKSILDKVLKVNTSHLEITVFQVVDYSDGGGERKWPVKKFGVGLIFDGKYEETYIFSGKKRKRN